MWYTVESDKSTIRNEGERSCKSTYNHLRKMFQLPSFHAVTLGLSGDFSSLVEWSQDTQVSVLPFAFGKDRRIKFDLVPETESAPVGTVWYGTSETISATFSRTSDAKDILGMFYPHWLIFYGNLDSEHTTMSIREIIEKL